MMPLVSFIFVVILYGLSFPVVQLYVNMQLNSNTNAVLSSKVTAGTKTLRSAKKEGDFVALLINQCFDQCLYTTFVGKLSW